MSRRNREHRRRKGRYLPPGSSPGMLITDPHAPKPKIRIMAYGPDGSVEQPIENPEAIRQHLGKWPVTWINVDGLGDAEVVRKIGEIFDLHRLALEDVVNVHQRAKAESFGRYYFIVGRMAEMDSTLGVDQLSLFLGRDYVLTFQEIPGDCFDPVRARIRKGGGRIRAAGADYLAYALIDAFVDHYFPVLEKYGEKLDLLEEEVVEKPAHDLMSRIHEVRRDLLSLRRAIWPLREAIGTLIRDDSPFVSAETRLYLRDCYDHVIQVIDLLENYRDLASSLVEVYLTSVSNRMNEIMKLLTIFTAVFIPMNLIAGIYGMNFHTDKSPWNMPELTWYLGYPFALLLMATLASATLFTFWRRGWFGSRPERGGRELR